MGRKPQRGRRRSAKVERPAKRVRPTPPSEEELAKIPRTFVLKQGVVARVVKLLKRDLRNAYRPWTATNLKEQRTSKLKDYIAVCGVLSISHVLVLRQRKDRVFLTFMRAKKLEGPSCTFRVLSYSLIKDVHATLGPKAACANDTDYARPPLVVLHGFDAKQEGPSGLTPEILQSIKSELFLSAFPKVTRESFKTSDTGTGAAAEDGLHRVVLFSYVGESQFEFRHYKVYKTEDFRQRFFPEKTKTELKAEDFVKKELLDESDRADFLKNNLSLAEIGPRLRMSFVCYDKTLSDKILVSAEEEDELRLLAPLLPEEDDDASSSDPVKETKEEEPEDVDDDSDEELDDSTDDDAESDGGESDSSLEGSDKEDNDSFEDAESEDEDASDK